MAFSYSLSCVTASPCDTLLSTTGSTTIATFTPSAAGNYKISAYFRVDVAATAVTVTFAWADADGAQSIAVLAAVTMQLGSYAVAEVCVNAVSGTAITVKMTAGTANQVSASATIQAT